MLPRHYATATLVFWTFGPCATPEDKNDNLSTNDYCTVQESEKNIFVKHYRLQNVPILMT